MLSKTVSRVASMACLAVIPLAMGACTGKSLSGVYDFRVREDNKMGRDEIVAHIQVDGKSFKGHLHNSERPDECAWGAFEGTFKDKVGHFRKVEFWTLDDDGWHIAETEEGMPIEFQWSKEGDTLRVTPRDQDDGKKVVLIGKKREGEKPFTGNLRDFPCKKR